MNPGGATSEQRRRRLVVALLVYAALAPAVAAALYISRGMLAGVPPMGFLRALLWQAPGYLLWAAIAPLLLLAGRRLRLRRGGWLAPMPIYVLLSIPVVLAHAWFTAWLDWRMDPGFAASAFAAVRADLMAQRLPIDLLLYWAMVGVIYAYEYNVRLRAGEAAARQLEAELTRAQLQALKAQLHPHFLFNALHTIAILIRSDAARAERMTVLLGDLLRTTLHRAAAQLVPLRDELALTRMYLAIEELRFGDRLTTVFDVDDAALAVCVPDLILQPHVENAIRHGVTPRRGPGTLWIRASCRDGTLMLEVEDDGIGYSAGGSGRGLGIGHRTTTERLRALYGERASFRVERRTEGTGTLVRIEMPAVTPEKGRSHA